MAVRRRGKNWQADAVVAGKRLQKSFPTKERAVAWIREKDAIALAAPGASVSELTDADRALQILRPLGLTLLDAARIAAASRPREIVTFGHARQQIEVDVRKLGRRPLYCDHLAKVWKSAGVRWDEKPLAAIGRDEIEDWLRSRSVGSVGRASYIRHLSALFGRAVRRGWLVSNPCVDVDRPSHQRTPPAVLSPAQGATLLAIAGRARVWVAVQMFAGLRPEEAIRLEWGAIGERIDVSAEVSKTRDRRLVDIFPALQRVLDEVKERAGRIYPVSDATLKRDRTEWRAKLFGGGPWPHDVLRHSFASYHLAQWRNSALTAELLGHRNSSMLYRHYREVVTPEAAAAWWRI